MWEKHASAVTIYMECENGYVRLTLEREHNNNPFNRAFFPVLVMNFSLSLSYSA